MVDLVDIVDPKDSVDIVDIVNIVSRLDMMDFDIVMELGARKLFDFSFVFWEVLLNLVAN